MILRWLILIAICCQGVAHAQYCPDGQCPTPPQYGGQYEPQVVPVQFPPQNMPPSQEVYAATVRVGSGDSRGSGSLIDSDGDTALVLTARHVLGNGECWVRFRDGQASRSLDVPLVDRDQADLCVLIINAPSGIKPIELASNDPPANEVVATLGYGSENKLGWFNCRYLRSFVNASNSSSLYELAGMARRGDSGGPVVNSAGQQFGVIMAVDQYERPTVVNGPCARPLLGFVSRVRQRWQEWIAKNRARKDAKPVGPLLPVPPREQAQSPDVNPAEPPSKAPAKKPDKLPIDPLDGVASAVESFTVRKIMEAVGLSTGGVVGWAAAAGLGFLLHRANKRLKAKAVAKVESVIHPSQTQATPAVDEESLISRITARIHASLSGVGQPEEQPAAVNLDEGPLQPVTVNRRINRYVEYDSAKTDRAWADAHAILVEKYPGYKTALSHAQRLKNQLLKGVPTDQLV